MQTFFLLSLPPEDESIENQRSSRLAFPSFFFAFFSRRFFRRISCGLTPGSLQRIIADNINLKSYPVVIYLCGGLITVLVWLVGIDSYMLDLSTSSTPAPADEKSTPRQRQKKKREEKGVKRGISLGDNKVRWELRDTSIVLIHSRPTSLSPNPLQASTIALSIFYHRSF